MFCFQATTAQEGHGPPGRWMVSQGICVLKDITALQAPEHPLLAQMANTATQQVRGLGEDGIAPAAD